MGPELGPAALLARLRDDLGYRRIQQGIQTLERFRPRIETLQPEPQAGVLVGLIAQWVDAGFDSFALLSQLLARFPKASRADLPLADYLHIRMAEGALAMSHEDFERATRHFLLVQSFDDDIDDPELFAIANFWTGRCFRKMGRYDEALKYTARAEEHALSRGYTQMAAIMQVTRSWLAFQRGRLHEANILLQRAEEALNPTDDFLSRGNIQSAYGRIARRQGKNDRAVKYFEKAIAEYRQGGGRTLSLARTLLNLAFVKRLVALHAQQHLDHVAATRRTARDTPADADSPAPTRLRIEQIRQQARTCLAEAEQIYTRVQNHRGLAGVRINQGFLHLDSGDLECAASEATEAFAHGNEKSDYIVMARARTLQCIIEHAAMEEQVGDPGHHHEAAETFARDAVAFAGHTENRRLLARAYVWQGLTFASEPSDLEAARRCCEQALALLQPEGQERQYVWDDLETLKSRVLEARPIDAVLRAWSTGVVEHKSFQQITDEFARIVIPKVWEREGRKVSRVAERLSISPKKVRRILHAAGVAHSPDLPHNTHNKH
jgi:tetratricopeptide (TPR) repeat protein